MRTNLVIFGVVGSLLSLSAWGAQITYYIDERGRRVYVNAEEPPKKPAATPKPKRSTRHSVLVREDPRTKQVVPVPVPPDAREAPETVAKQQEPAAQPQSPALAAQQVAPPKDVDEIIVGTAERHAIDPDLVRAIVKVESNFNPTAVSRKGAMGLMQLVPRTAQRFGVFNVFDPQENVDAGVRYLKHLLGVYNGNLKLSLAAYNAGEKAVDRHNGIPPYPETRQYVSRISSLYQSGYVTTPFGLLTPDKQSQQRQPDRWGIMKRLDEKGTVHFSNTEGW